MTAMELTREQHAMLQQLAEASHLNLIVLYGSQAKGRVHAESDSDIAVRGSHELSLDECLALAAELDRLFPNAEVCDIRNAPPLLLAAIAQDGISLFESRPGEFARFRIMAYNSYWDFKPVLDRAARATREAIRKL